MKLLAQHLPSYAAVAGLLLTVIVAAWTDLRHWRIPNQLLAPSAAAALMLSVFAPGAQGLTASLLGGLVGLMVFMPLDAASVSAIEKKRTEWQVNRARVEAFMASL